MIFRLRHRISADVEQQQNNEALIDGLNQIAQFVYAGTGAPTFTPPGAAIYFRADFGVNTAVYVYDGSWKSVT